MSRNFKNKSRPFIIESQWLYGRIKKDWRFFRRFATEAAALDAVETALCRANFIKYRLLNKGQVVWVKQ